METMGAGKFDKMPNASKVVLVSRPRQIGARSVHGKPGRHHQLPGDARNARSHGRHDFRGVHHVQGSGRKHAGNYPSDASALEEGELVMGFVVILLFGISAYIYFKAAYPIPEKKDGGSYEI